MANKLIEELLIKVKTSGAKGANKDLSSIASKLKYIKENKDTSINIAVPAVIEKSLKGISSQLGKLVEETEMGNDSLGMMEHRMDDAANATEKFRKKTSKTAKGMEKMTRAGNSQARSMSALAKMAGPLPLLYANVAANVFALSEAFRLVTEGEQLNRLEQVGTIIGSNIGVPVQSLANKMIELTGYTLSYGDAMRQATAAASYGFDSEQIEMMTMAARRASIALGVDMQDAMNRVIKGTSKLEIELLDEIGVTTKLTTAYQHYAEKLGVAATSLNSYQQRAALVNEINAQSIDKFGDLADKVGDANPWERFGANATSALQDFTKNVAESTSSFANFLNTIDETQSRANGVYDVAKNLQTSFTEALSSDSRSGLLGLAVESNKELEKMQARFRELSAMDLKSGFAGWSTSDLKDEYNALKVSIGQIQTLLGQDLGVDSIEKASAAYKNLNIIVKGSKPAYESSIASIKGQSAAYEKLYTDVESMQTAYNLAKKADPAFDTEKALASLGFESEATMNKAVNLARAYRDTNSALELFAATSAKASLEQRKQGTDQEIIKLGLVQKELKYQEELLATQIKLDVLPTKRAATEAKIANLSLQELDTRIAIVDTETKRANIESGFATSGQNELFLKKELLFNERTRLTNLQGMVGTQLQQEQSLNRVKQLENDILNIQTAQSNTMMNSALSNLGSFAPGISQMTSSVNELAMSFNNMGESSMTSTQMISSGLNAFQGMLSYASNDAIQAVDAQINAEKKRDGKSKESVAKIAGLEKKKIDAQKKAAKQSILISTAVAVMNAAANPWPVPAIPLMAAATVAGGLALSQASSASSNTMSGVAESTKASLSVGKRSSDIDVSRGPSMGELSYLRGESGIGSAQSFTPRANGGIGTPGNSLIVGEEGPEIITPLESIRVYNAEASKGKSGGSSGGFTYSPTINALDAQSIVDRAEDIGVAVERYLNDRGQTFDRL